MLRGLDARRSATFVILSWAALAFFLVAGPLPPSSFFSFRENKFNMTIRLQEPRLALFQSIRNHCREMSKHLFVIVFWKAKSFRFGTFRGDFTIMMIKLTISTLLTNRLSGWMVGSIQHSRICVWCLSTICLCCSSPRRSLLGHQIHVQTEKSQGFPQFWFNILQMTYSNSSYADSCCEGGGSLEDAPVQSS